MRMSSSTPGRYALEDTTAKRMILSDPDPFFRQGTSMISAGLTYKGRRNCKPACDINWCGKGPMDHQATALIGSLDGAIRCVRIPTGLSKPGNKPHLACLPFRYASNVLVLTSHQSHYCRRECSDPENTTLATSSTSPRQDPDPLVREQPVAASTSPP
jgi:hypothetical protein